jgi:hypothetical protein
MGRRLEARHMRTYDPGFRSTSEFTLRFTPAEWRSLLHDGSFLRDPDNSFSPRRLMGLPVQIVPDHRLYDAPGRG